MKKFQKQEDYGTTYERVILYKDGSKYMESYFQYTLNHPYDYFIKSYFSHRMKNIIFFMHLKNKLDIEENFKI